MINVIDEALDGCQRALLILNAYEIQKESGMLTSNDEALSIRMIIENLSGAIDKLKNTEPHAQYIKSETEIINQNSFAERLKFALKEQGMTQGVLADWTGISQSTISSMATGKIKNIDTPRAEAIAKALSVSFAWLMNGEGSIYGSNFSTNNNEV
ncbi:helix-turn-helix domain-containing protein [Providencia rettgeri]|uniref:helix-turn-helix domain-containing protein n=1 Tax=Providencia rettgeri TaxID=587 RepID=UPI001CFC7A0B|nr:helix-turn-helix transcriptional regulator [Providencia rettgeri]EIU7558827.1 helix-turn-helix transcriptional regulator [Providencia rettgeri]MCB4842756.1 helix-turn-helix domain-containing protein [Providencia rettgeri]